MVSVESLVMTWISGQEARLDHDIAGGMQFQLPRMTSLKIAAIGSDWDEDTYADSQRFLELFRLVALPSLTHLSLLFREISEDALTDILTSLILRHGHPDEGGGVTTLRTFTLRTQVMRYELRGISDLRLELLDYMRGVEHVYIEGPGARYLGDGSTIPFTWSPDEYHSGAPPAFPNLQSITVKHCLRIDRLFLQAFAADINRQEDEEPFRMLKLVECPLVTSPVVAELLQEHCDIGHKIIFQTKVSPPVFSMSIYVITSSVSGAISSLTAMLMKRSPISRTSRIYISPRSGIDDRILDRIHLSRIYPPNLKTT